MRPVDRAAPQLWFFAELGDRDLDDLLTPAVLAALQRRGAGIAVGLLDLSERRAATLARAQRAGVPLTAWLLLSEADGYWLTLDNADAASARWQQTHAWIRRHALAIRRVGLDIEVPHHRALALVERPVATSVELVRQRRSADQHARGRAAYAELVRQIRAAGLEVETYQIPLIADERRAGTTILQRASGVVDVAADREVLMLYRSAVPAALAHGLVHAYGRDAQAIAVGITGGGVRSLQPAFAARELDRAGLQRELAAAAHYTDQLYVFSLEGCVRRGDLEAICAAELRPGPPQPSAALRHLPAVGTRAALQTILRLETAVHAARRWRRTLPRVLSDR